MELTDIPDDTYESDESPPDLNELESPDALLTGGPIRERLLDVVTKLRTPTTVSDIADPADFAEWFTATTTALPDTNGTTRTSFGDWFGQF